MGDGRWHFLVTDKKAAEKLYKNFQLSLEIFSSDGSFENQAVK
jgi:hypothetical protein